MDKQNINLSIMRILLALLIAICISSCVEMTKKECVEGYLKADDWYFGRIRLAGDNQEAIDAIYEEYLDKYRELDSKCK